MAYLEIRIAQEVRHISLDRDHLRIGRLAENDIVLRDAQISRQHAELRCMSGQWRILDLGSTNGLHFNGKRVPEHSMASGDLVLLAPTVTLCFHDGAAPADAISTAAPATSAQSARPSQAPIATAMPTPSASPASPPSVTPWPAQPGGSVASAAPMGSAPAGAAPVFDLLRPRSPFADDEQPYYPPGMGMPAPPTQYNRQYAPSAANGVAASSDSQSYASQFDTIPASGYPAPAGPLTSGSDGQDPFRRSSVNVQSKAQRRTSGPTSTLLHVCQTCGQLTAPDAVYCQSCHHSIARECANCRLSLLPIQERCPRCQTPNPGSVRRAHRAAGA